MFELFLYFFLLVVLYLWTLAVKHHYVGSGPLWLRILCAISVIGTAFWAVAAFVDQTMIFTWAEAFVNVSLVLVALFSAILMAFLLLRMNSNLYLCLREK